MKRRAVNPGWNDSRGAVYVEFLIAFIPFFVFFLCLWQASIVYYTKLLVDHAAFAAARAAAVIVAENPNRVDPNGGASSVNTLTKSRADYVRIAAELALAPSIMDNTTVLLDVKFPPGDQPGAADVARDPPPAYTPMSAGGAIQMMRVRVETWMVCKIALANAIMCPANTVLGLAAKQLGVFVLRVRSEAIFPYQGAQYTYDPNDDNGRSAHDAMASALGSMCFAAGTPVETAAGERAIEDLRAGDLVLSRDEATGAVEPEPVVRTFVTPDQPLVEVSLGGSAPIRVTPTHRFGTTDRGWVPAADLAPGEAVVTASGAGAEVLAVTPLAARETVYNLAVEKTHTYFVGASGAWVHNDGCDTAIPSTPTLPGGGGGSGGGGSSSGGGGGGGTGGGGSSSSSSSSSSGAATVTPGNFQPGQLQAHFDKHKGEWPPGLTQQQYLDGARNLLSQFPGGNVLGFTRANGDVLRYDTATNEFAVMAKDGTIRTYFRPTNGINYWNSQVAP
ncbi:MAG: Hint domain-containing protein [Myxococcales bacterium]|nr:Hint domain-containing protein [Myxococcales bacterium]